MYSQFERIDPSTNFYGFGQLNMTQLSQARHFRALFPTGAGKVTPYLEKVQGLLGWQTVEKPHWPVFTPLLAYCLHRVVFYQEIFFPNSREDSSKFIGFNLYQSIEANAQFMSEVIRAIEYAKEAWRNFDFPSWEESNRLENPTLLPGSKEDISVQARIDRLKLYEVTMRQCEKYFREQMTKACLSEDKLHQFQGPTKDKSKFAKSGFQVRSGDASSGVNSSFFRPTDEPQVASLQVRKCWKYIRDRNKLTDLEVEDYFDELFKEASKIEPLTEQQQMQRMRQSLKYSHIFDNQMQESTIDIKGLNSRVNLRVPIPDYRSPVILTLQEHLMSQDYSKKENEAQAVSLVLMIHEYLVHTFNRVDLKSNKIRYCDFLSPTSVVFDQLSLTPRVSLEQVIRRVIGLGQQPFSSENRLAFAPTPKGFDLFRAQCEFQQSTQLIMRDPFFASRRPGVPLPQPEERHWQEITEKMQVERFLLLTHFIRNGEELGRKPEVCSLKKQEAHFKKVMSSKKQDLSKDINSLGQWIGVEKERWEGGFNFSAKQLEDYLTPQQIVDNEEVGQILFQQIFQLRNNLYEELQVHLRKCPQALLKHPKQETHQHIAAHLVAVYYALRQSQMLLKERQHGKFSSLSKYEERLFEQIVAFEDSIKNRPKQVNEQSKSDTFSKCLTTLEILHELLNQIKDLYASTTRSSLLMQQISDLSQYSHYFISEALYMIKTQLASVFTQSEISLDLFKQQQVSEQSRQVFRCRLHMLWEMFLMLSEDNLLDIESLILPMITYCPTDSSKYLEYQTFEKSEDAMEVCQVLQQAQRIIKKVDGYGIGMVKGQGKESSTKLDAVKPEKEWIKWLGHFKNDEQMTKLIKQAQSLFSTDNYYQRIQQSMQLVKEKDRLTYVHIRDLDSQYL